MDQGKISDLLLIFSKVFTMQEFIQGQYKFVQCLDIKSCTQRMYHIPLRIIRHFLQSILFRYENDQYQIELFL